MNYQLPLTGHYGFSILIGEAISDDVATYEVTSKAQRTTTLTANWNGEDYTITIARAPESP